MLFRSTVTREVIIVIRRTLLIHLARIPVAFHRHGLRPPVRPDAELRIAKPLGAFIVGQRLHRAGKFSGRDRQIHRRRTKLAQEKHGETGVWQQASRGFFIHRKLLITSCETRSHTSRIGRTFQWVGGHFLSRRQLFRYRCFVIRNIINADSNYSFQ